MAAALALAGAGCWMTLKDSDHRRAPGLGGGPTRAQARPEEILNPSPLIADARATTRSARWPVEPDAQRGISVDLATGKPASPRSTAGVVRAGVGTGDVAR